MAVLKSHMIFIVALFHLTLYLHLPSIVILFRLVDTDAISELARTREYKYILNMQIYL